MAPTRKGLTFHTAVCTTPGKKSPRRAIRMKVSIPLPAVAIPVIALLSSCVMPAYPTDFTSIEEITAWTYENIQYLPDEENIIDWDLNIYDEWQTPKVTLRRGTGDCEDMASLIAFLAQQSLGVHMRLYLLEGIGQGVPDHMNAEYGGRFYEGTLNVVFDSLPAYYQVIDTLTLDDYMNIATYNLFRSPATIAQTVEMVTEGQLP
jgi:hypothetical protein